MESQPFTGLASLNLAGVLYTFRIDKDGSLFVAEANQWRPCARLQLECGHSVTDDQIKECIRLKNENAQ